jgi:hypothetical protein
MDRLRLDENGQGVPAARSITNGVGFGLPTALESPMLFGVYCCPLSP